MPPKKDAKPAAKAAAPPAAPPVPVDEGPNVHACLPRLDAAFKIFDPEATKFIAIADLMPFLCSLDIFMTAEEVKEKLLPQLVETPPAAADGAAVPPVERVTYERVLKVVLPMLGSRAYPPPGAEALLAAFRAFDKAGSGEVEVDKLRRALTNPAVPGALTAEQFSDLLKLLPAVPRAPDAEADEPARVRYTDYITLAGRR